MSKIIVPRTIHVFVSLVLCTVSIVSLANTDSTMAMLEALESEWNQASVLDCAPKFSLGNSTSFPRCLSLSGFTFLGTGSRGWNLIFFAIMSLQLLASATAFEGGLRRTERRSVQVMFYVCALSQSFAWPK